MLIILHHLLRNHAHHYAHQSRGHVVIGRHVLQVVIKPELVTKPQTAKAEFHHQRLRNLAVMFHNALHTVGHVEIGQVALQTVIKHEFVVKIPTVKAEHHHRPLLNPVPMPQLARPTHGNAAVGELAHRKESKPEVAIKLLIALLLKLHRQPHRNIVNRHTNQIIKFRHKIQK